MRSEANTECYALRTVPLVRPERTGSAHERVPMATTTPAAVSAPPLDQLRADSRLSRVVRGVVGGELAGAVFAVLTVWFITSIGGELKTGFLLFSTIATGSDSLDTGTASVATGLLVHLGVAALYGALFALIVPRMRTNGTVLLAAGIFGLGVYLLDFRVFSPIWFPAFQQANQPFELLVHLLYGQLLALIFLSRGYLRRERRFDWSWK